jgi:hypothetical protein
MYEFSKYPKVFLHRKIDFYNEYKTQFRKIGQKLLQLSFYVFSVYYCSFEHVQYGAVLDGTLSNNITTSKGCHDTSDTQILA